MGESKNSKKSNLSQFMKYTKEELKILNGEFDENETFDIKKQENFVEKNIEYLY